MDTIPVVDDRCKCRLIWGKRVMYFGMGGGTKTEYIMQRSAFCRLHRGEKEYFMVEK